jgi:hypothetical protein
VQQDLPVQQVTLGQLVRKEFKARLVQLVQLVLLVQLVHKARQVHKVFKVL